jgi:integrase
MSDPTEIQQRFTGAKLPLKPMHVWGIRVRLQVEGRIRDLALFDLAIDSKLRGCDLVALRMSDLVTGGSVRRRGLVLQQKTSRPVQFEITEQARQSVRTWLNKRGERPDDWLFPSRQFPGAHLSTRQYSRLLKQWVELLGLEPSAYGTHRYPCSTERPAIFALASSCLATPNSRAQFAISASS